MKRNSSRTGKGKLHPKKPDKPRPDFPLYAHAQGRWAKKVRGSTVYFTKWEDDPQGQAALEQWVDQKDDLLAGRVPRDKKPDELTVRDLCNEFCTHYEVRRNAGEIKPRTYQCLHATCATLVKVFGKQRAVSDLRPEDFGELKKHYAKTRQATAMRSEIGRARSVFLYAFKSGLIDRDVQYGTKFDKPPKRQERRSRREHRQKHGDRMLKANEIRMILDYLDGKRVTPLNSDKPVSGPAKPALKAMVLLGVNCGFGQSDISELPKSVVDLDNAMIDFPRPKTEADRICPLWPETIAAIREWLPIRPAASADRADHALVFLTQRGRRWVRTGKNGIPIDGLGQEFNKVLTTLGLKRPKVGFYALRHSFRTVADETLDPVAINLIMGHTDDSMAGHYRELVGDGRLHKVSEYVRQWLFGDSPEDSGPNNFKAESCDPSGPSDPRHKYVDESGSQGAEGSQNSEPSYYREDDDDAPRLRLFVG